MILVPSLSESSTPGNSQYPPPSLTCYPFRSCISFSRRYYPEVFRVSNVQNHVEVRPRFEFSDVEDSSAFSSRFDLDFIIRASRGANNSIDSFQISHRSEDEQILRHYSPKRGVFPFLANNGSTGLQFYPLRSDPFSFFHLL